MPKRLIEYKYGIKKREHLLWISLPRTRSSGSSRHSPQQTSFVEGYLFAELGFRVRFSDR